VTQDDHKAQIAGRFGVIARKYCAVVDSARSLEKSDLLNRMYEVLPALIDAAIHLPDVSVSDSTDGEPNENSSQGSPTARMADAERHELYQSLREKLGDTDLYRMVFDAAKSTEAIHGSLADDIADIYRDLREGIVLMNESKTSPQNVIWEWRLGFESHWGHHAMNALKTIHDIRNY
jgi:hypothetical protein